MDTRNKAILGMFTLAFCSLAGLQIAGKAINYSTSSVLGEQVTSESAVGGKLNFSKCQLGRECKSTRCDEVAKVCIPKDSPTRTPQNIVSNTEKVEGSAPGYIPCSELMALETKYCADSSKSSRLEGSLSCQTYKRNIALYCK